MAPRDFMYICIYFVTPEVQSWGFQGFIDLCKFGFPEAQIQCIKKS